MKLQKINEYNKLVFDQMFEDYLEELNDYFYIPSDDNNRRGDEWLQYYYESSFHEGYLLQDDNQFIGFCLICNTTFNLKDDRLFLSEFYISKNNRKNHYGKHFAKKVFNLYPGKWELSVHPKNLISIKFWDNVINDIDKNYIKTKDIPKIFDDILGIVYDFQVN